MKKKVSKVITVRLDEKTVLDAKKYANHYGISVSKYFKLACYRFFITKNKYDEAKIFEDTFQDEIQLCNKKKELYDQINS